MLNSKQSSELEKVFLNPVFNLLISVVFAVLFLYMPAQQSIEQAFGPFTLKIIVLAEFISAAVVAISMGLTGKLLYKILNSFSIKIVFAFLLSLILIFSMIDKIFVFFILALLFLIVNMYAVEAEQKYFSGNIPLIIFLFSVVVYQYTKSVPLIFLFLIQYILGSSGRKIKSYDWLIFSLYFVMPVTYYGSGNISIIKLWMGLYFIFKAAIVFLEAFRLDIFEVGERARKISGLPMEKKKYFWSEGEELFFIILLAAPIFFRFILGLDPEKIIPIWLVILFVFVAGSLFFIDPSWWKKYHKYR